jgi:hypothetical protein
MKCPIVISKYFCRVLEKLIFSLKIIEFFQKKLPGFYGAKAVSRSVF